MPQAERNDPEPATVESPALADAPPVADLLATIAALKADNAKLRAERGPPPPEWMALKSAPRAGYSYEATRQWCTTGLVTAEKRRGRWFVLVASMIERLKELAAIR